MFAPYCPTCGTRRLLGVSRIVRTDWEQGGAIHLRCTCGAVIQERPGRRTSGAQQPVDELATRDSAA